MKGVIYMIKSAIIGAVIGALGMLVLYLAGRNP